MALITDINDLLNKHKVEDNRIEFKRGWNPETVYHSICAFANDIDNLGGGYILIGVEEENGVAKRPVYGIPESQIDGIQKAMQGFNQKIKPYYLPRTSVERVDDKLILVIWVPTGTYRPYSVPVNVNVKGLSKEEFYVRNGSSSIPARGEVLDELRDMASRVSFDERPNPDIKPSDISITLLSDYLEHVHSKIPPEEISSANKMSILDQMDLLSGPTESRMIRNVAAMMFCENPQRFFPYSQIEVVLFPEGRIENPDNMIEIPPFKGPIPKVIAETLTYLRTNIIKEHITKPTDDEHSLRYFNYPYQALEEAVVNAMYHRDYQVREPVEITIEPNMITILSFSGPDRSISMEAIHKAELLKSRRYRNRRLGEFFKELELTEGRATGIPTIQRQLKNNGSPRARIETDTERSFFMIEIPCKEEMVGMMSLDSNQSANKSGTSLEQVQLDGFEEVRKFWNKSGTSLEQVETVLNAAKTAKTKKELMENATFKSPKLFRLNILLPLMKLELLQMTIPEKPNSSKQKYILTDKGIAILTSNPT